MQKPDAGTWFLLLFSAFSAGVLIAAQAGVNAQLGKRVGNPILGALISFLIGTVILSVVFLSLRIPWPSLSQVARESPWWIWFGGIMGAIFVATTTVVAPRIGSSNLICAVVAGQMLVSLLIDHYGWIGFPKSEVSVTRLLGAGLLIVGVLLIQRK
jgi:bacterial/archaeal transporter family-2 protein